MRKKCGCLPKMVTASKGSTVTLLPLILFERVNLVDNQVVTKVNSLLLPDGVDVITAL